MRGQRGTLVWNVRVPAGLATRVAVRPSTTVRRPSLQPEDKIPFNLSCASVSCFFLQFFSVNPHRLMVSGEQAIRYRQRQSLERYAEEMCGGTILVARKQNRSTD